MCVCEARCEVGCLPRPERAQAATPRPHTSSLALHWASVLYGTAPTSSLERLMRVRPPRSSGRDCQTGARVRGSAVAIAHAAEELVRVALERDLDQVPKVVPRGLHGDVQRVPGVPHDEDREEDEVAEPEGEAAEVRDAPLQAEDHREGRDERDADDN